MIDDLISIIIPVYNAEKFLPRSIESIINQTYHNIQIIVVNDGSTDGSLKVIEKYAACDDRILVINKQNNGVSEARNSGLDVADGSYIGFVDADDFIEPNMYEKLYKELIYNNADICCCGYRHEYSGFRYDISTNHKQILESTEIIVAQYLRQDIRNGIFDGNWNKLFSKKCIENIRYKSIKHCEDILFQYYAFLKCTKMVCIPDLLYHHVNTDGSASCSRFTVDRLSCMDVAREVLHITLSRYPRLIKQAYAFNLTWNLSVLQDYYDDNEVNVDIKAAKQGIWREFIKNRRLYLRNHYSKRLDQVYYISYVIGVMKIVMKIRSFVRNAKPSDDMILTR